MQYTLKSINCEPRPLSLIAEPEEMFEVSVLASNTGWLPAMYMWISESVPTEILISETNQNTRKTQLYESTLSKDMSLEHTLWLSPRHASVITLKASLPRRGCYQFGNLRVEVGDMFGLNSAVKVMPGKQEVVILPKLLEAPEELGTLGTFLGEISTHRWILEDPVLAISYSEYTGRESIRHIDWPRSLRNGQLTVRQFDHTTELAVTVILNTQRSEGIDTEAVERCFSLTRGVCEMLESRRIRYSFITNAVGIGAFSSRRTIAEGQGKQHLMTILEGLGRSSNTVATSFEKLLNGIEDWSERDRTHILITPGFPSEWEIMLSRSIHGGRGLLVIDGSKED